MKRFLFVLVILFLLTGCYLLNPFGFVDNNNKEVTTTVTVNKPGDVYLVKLNVSDDIVRSRNTGYVSWVSRFADSDNNENDTDKFLRDRNSEFYKKLSAYLTSGERSAERAAINSPPTSPRTFTTNEEFYAFVNTNKVGNSTINIAGIVNAKKQYDGEHCYVYADENLPNDIKSQCTALGQKFDSCYSKEIAIIGNPYYDTCNSEFFVPCNDKIVILVCDLFGDAKPNQQAGTAGYFNPCDLFSQSFLDSSSLFNKGKDPTADTYDHSNHCEMYYIDSQFLKESPNKIYSTLVHEFNHLINFVIKTLKYMNGQNSISKIRYCNSWFTEMLAMTTEDMFQDFLGLDDSDTPKDRLINFGMHYRYGFTAAWESNLDSAIPYANTYAFGAFLARNFGGVDLIEHSAQNDEVNEKASTKALQVSNPNITYKDEKTGITKPIDFEYALRKFTICVVNTGPGEDYSLNRSTGFKNGLGFTAVDITGTYIYKGATYPVPFTYMVNQEGQVDIYPTGFSVHYIGRDISSFTFCTTNTSDLEYYLIQ